MSEDESAIERSARAHGTERSLPPAGDASAPLRELAPPAPERDDYNLAARVYEGPPVPRPVESVSSEVPAPLPYNLASRVYDGPSRTSAASWWEPVVPASASPVGAAVLAVPGRQRGAAARRTFAALGDRHFRMLYLGNIMQFGAMQMQLLVRGVLVFQLTGSFAALGLVSLANALPGLALSLVGGVAADRMPKKTLIQSAQMINAANAAVLAVLAGFGLLSFTHLMISAALQGGVNAIMMPSRQSIISDLVPRERLMNAIAINTSGQNLMQLVGPALGGALLAVLNPSAVFGLMTALYLAAVSFSVRLPTRPLYAQPARARVGGRSAGGFRDLAAGLRYVGADPTIRLLIGVNFLIVLASMPYTMMLPGFVHEVLHKGAAEQGLMMALSGLGAVVGSFAVASMSGARRGRTLVASAVLLGVALLAFAFSPSYYVTLPIMLFIGMATALRMSLGQVLIQSYSADEYRGRVMAVWMMQFSLVSLGTFLVGLISEALGVQVAIGGLAAGLVLAMLLTYLVSPRIRSLD